MENRVYSLGARLEIDIGYLTKYWKRSRAVVKTAMAILSRDAISKPVGLTPTMIALDQ